MEPSDTINVVLDYSSSNDQFRTMLDTITQIRSSIMNVHDSISNSERIRDQFTIHLRQCQEDSSILRNIYKSLKIKVDSKDQESKPAVAPAAACETKPQAQPEQSETPAIDTAFTGKFVPAPDLTSSPDLRCKFCVKASAVICSVQFSHDGKWIAFANGQSIFVLDSNDGSIIHSIPIPDVKDPSHSHNRAISFSPNDKQIAISSSNNDCVLFEVQSHKCINSFKGHTKEVSSILFNETGKWLITGGFDEVLNIWDTEKLTLVKTINHSTVVPDSAIVSLASSSDCSFYAVGFANGLIGIYNQTFDSPMMNIQAHSQNLLGVSISPFDETIATTSQDGTIILWVLRGIAQRKYVLQGHNDYVIGSCFSPKAGLIFTGAKDQTIKVWNTKTGTLIGTATGHQNTIFQIHHHPTLNSIVASSGDGHVSVWTYSDLKL